MTNETDRDHSEIKRRLKAVRPAGPSRQLRERVVGATREAWRVMPPETPWRLALGRLAAAAVAAVVIVSCADYLSNRVIAPWQSGEVIAVDVQDDGVEEFPEVSFGPLVKRIAATRTPTGLEASGPLGYVERIQETLAEVEHHDGADAFAPGPGSSYLFPGRSGLSCCS
jgi:hypothetical protein